ncbi:hypothetical protein GCM10011344_06930 [Dokdonia pacifica]|uniref:DUF4252 domain-containing protein n=1 Tax=Dokdonia pacifica TaxID=1627892 RepID=A0A238Z083_9FLAO|nr:DUF4252 domain-containing protein [Dokdonia pacifica]GGG08957.1 hypothetical protein GCM10011344_06930 [Dokdonia pacifica]SNR76835.1 protein of unknown function [Dokdonia pacifica]
MFKRLLLLIGIALLTSCGSYNSIDAFYNAHKNENQVKAVRVPRFMFTLLSSISPETNTLIGNTKDIRYMEFPSKTSERTSYLNEQMTKITSNSFIEVYRNNDNDKRNVISIRERGDVVKEILVYKNDATKGSFFYFNGNFDPVQIRKMVANKDFDKLGDGLINQFTNTSSSTPGIIQN